MGTGGNISLLKLVMIQMNCGNTADLGMLDKWQKRYLIWFLQRLDPCSPSLGEWNQLLDITLALPAEPDCYSARAHLISGLSA